MPVELHCHTLFSVDGRGTPEALVDTAAARGITTLAITEHNHLGSQQRGRRAAERHGIRWIAGVEIDAAWQGGGVHLLALGIDPDSPPLRAVIEANHARYQRQYELFMELLGQRYCPLSDEQIRGRLPQRYPGHPEPVANLWFVRSLLREIGIDDFPIGEIQAQIREQRGPDAFGALATLEQARDAVRAAGGALLLAHVGEYAPGDADRQLAMIDAALEQGVDGFELYHPKNLREAHFERLVEKARQTGCAISGGSDCHDAASDGPNRLGGVEVQESVLDTIEPVLERRRTGLGSGSPAP